MSRIAIVGLACRYPDADSPAQLWANAVAGRRAFRRLPDERMRLADYWSPDPAAPDRFYAQQAAVIQGYAFDRVRYRVAGSTYRSTDLTHWLALDVATEALADAGFPDGDELPRERTGVVVGNSLTGEFARANLMRLRWPYVRRTLTAALQAEGWDGERLGAFLAGLEERYKQPFPPIDEDSLAGGLSNTIAGRICNYYDLKGGGYTVDGACSSSLLSVATACRALNNHELDVAVAGGVDLSIDPFEIVGFAKTGALATGEMRVYDRRSSGFWPGEGCGMVVLMREPEARAAGHRVYATIPGWGISSDGKGGITRPELGGYRLMVRRAYRQAGFGIVTVGLFEGHGTGTPVGNEVELTALSMARREAAPDAPPAAIGSIKAQIGHTKAAAGVAGLIKAAMAVHHEVLPPTVGCVEPHPVLCEPEPALRVLPVAESWPAGVPVRAGVTAMGFGGINTHVVVENPQPRRTGTLPPPVAALTRLAAGTGTEVLVVDAEDPQLLRQRVEELADPVSRLSYAELGDLAAQLPRQLAGRPHRAAVVAGSPEQAAGRLHRLAELLGQQSGLVWEPAGGLYASRVDGAPRIGFLFPGQGSGNQPGGGALRWRFAEADQVFAEAALPAGGDATATAVAQPRIVAGSLAGLQVLAALGIDAAVAVGHSLGELSALHWAGSIDATTLLRIAELRGRVMAEHSDPGTMASIAAAPGRVEPLLAGTPVVVAGYNGPRQTVVAGPEAAVRRVCDRAGESGLEWMLVPVSHAFHSPLVARSATALAQHLAVEQFGPPARAVISTVTGARLARDTDLAALLQQQIVAPVRFADALTAAVDVDLFVEVGPGTVLSRLAADVIEVPVLPLDTDSRSLAPLLHVVAAAFVAGAPVRFERLAAGRPERPAVLEIEPRFFASPCEDAPAVAAPPPTVTPATAGDGSAEPAGAGSLPGVADADTLDLVRGLVAARAELPDTAVEDDNRLLDDLHLSSITVGQVFIQATQLLGLPAGQAPTSFATATVKEFATALDELRATSQPGDIDEPATVAGVRSWVRPFRTDWVPGPDLPAPAGEPPGDWRVYARDGHPLAEPLRRALAQAAVGGGVLVCLAAGCPEPELELALLAAKAAVTQPPGHRFVVVQQGRGAAAIAKTARLEATDLRTTVVDTPLTPAAVERIVAEVAATTGFREVRYDAAGTRLVPVLRPVTVKPGAAPLTADDVLLVTGGGRGITAECALALVAGSGARLAILGRSDPAADPELAANLARMAQAGITVHYQQADVTDAAAVRTATASVTAALGKVTAILHGAGSNEPAALSGLDRDAFRRTLAPKLDGLAALLDAVDGRALRLLVTFGSIIGRGGLRGEAHYATANDWLAEATVAAGQRFPGCRVLCLEWSVWSGAGMGERLSVIQSLVREGIAPITVDDGVEALRRLLADPQLPPVVVVTSRADGVDTLSYDRPPLPLLRFADRVLVHYPGVELVAETTLAPGSDPYLEDHLLDGNLLFPAVLGMEAMAQVAAALRDEPGSPVIERAEFARPIVVPPGGQTTIRVAALVTGPDEVEVAIRSEETGYGTDHFRATLRYHLPEPAGGGPEPAAADLPPVPLDPASDLYGGVLFQGGRFQRLRRYRRVAARRAEASVARRDESWFAPYLPGELRLGDPGARDAVMHGLQVCVPHATLLPAGIDRLYPAAGDLDAAEVTFVATERERDGDTYWYDIVVRRPDGAVVERWDGLRLRAVRKSDGRGPWPPVLLGPYLQRRLDELLGVELAVVVEPGVGRTGTALAARRALDREVEFRYRPDGRPELPGEQMVSATHGAGVTMVVTGGVPVGCDLEPVVARPAADWAGLLNPHQALVEQLLGPDGGHDLAATRIWCALEALQKCGQPRGGPLTVDSDPSEPWLLLRAGGSRVATLTTSFTGVDQPVVVAVAIREEG
jgi:enediyne polyketide synthase